MDQVLADETFVAGSGGQQVSDEVLWQLGDQQGTIRDIVDDNAVLRKSVNYDSFGNFGYEQYYYASGYPIESTEPVELNEEAVDQLFYFTGQEADRATGLYNYNARWYSPSIGRFVSEDPSGVSEGNDPNFYRYVGNSPTNRTDPTGLVQAGNPLNSLFGGYRAGPVQPYNPISSALAAGSNLLANPLGSSTINVLQAAPFLANFSLTTPARTTSLPNYGTPSVQQSFDYFRNQPGYYENLAAAARTIKLPSAPLPDPSGITPQYVQSGAARREVERSAQEYAQGAVTYGTWSQAFAGQFALTLNNFAENSHPAAGQLYAIDALTDRNASFTQKVVATGLGLLDTLLLSQASGLSGAARTAVRTETNVAVQTTNRIQQELRLSTQLERTAQSQVESLGERVIQTQYAQGAVQRGIDFGSYAGSGVNAKLFLNEVKNVTGEVAERAFTALGLGKSGIKSFNQAKAAVNRAIRAAGLDAATERALLQQLENGGTAVIRLIGSQAKGTVFDPAVIDAIGKATKFIAGHGFNI